MLVKSCNLPDPNSKSLKGEVVGSLTYFMTFYRVLSPKQDGTRQFHCTCEKQYGCLLSLTVQRYSSAHQCLGAGIGGLGWVDQAFWLGEWSHCVWTWQLEVPGVFWVMLTAVKSMPQTPPVYVAILYASSWSWWSHGSLFSKMLMVFFVQLAQCFLPGEIPVLAINHLGCFLGSRRSSSPDWLLKPVFPGRQIPLLGCIPTNFH